MALHKDWRLSVVPIGPMDLFKDYTTLDLRFDGLPDTDDAAASSIVFNARFEGALFDDTGKVITALGNAALSTTEKKFGLSSLYLDGTGDYCTVPSSSGFDLGAGDFTIESQVMPKTSRSQYLVAINIATEAFSTVAIKQDADGRIRATFAATSAGNLVTIVSPFAVPVDFFAHVAFTRSGSLFTLWVDGINAGSATSSASAKSGCSLTIGAVNDDTGTGASPLHGYLDDVRITKGVCRYFAAFTAPTSGIPVCVTQTPICDLKGHQVTVVGNTNVVTTPIKLGTGAGHFDGTNDVLNLPNSPDLNNFGTGDFTIECFARVTSIATAEQNLINCGVSWASSIGYALVIRTSDIRFYAGNSTPIAITSPTSTLAANTWYHFAVSRNSGTTKLYVNGTSVGTPHVGSVSISTSSLIHIGSLFDGTGDLNGYIDQIRITKGVGRYPSNFTAPTEKVSFAHIAFKESVGGPALTISGNGTASVSSTSVGDADKAFDTGLSSSDLWVSALADFTPAAAWNFGSGNEQDIRAVTIQNSSDASYLPLQAQKMVLQYSDDGGSTWVDLLPITHDPSVTSASATYEFVPQTGTGAIFLPAPLITAFGGSTGILSMQAAAAAGYGGAAGAMVVQAPSMTGNSGIVGSLLVQAPLMRGVGRATTGDNAGAIVLPAPAVIGYGGAIGAMVVDGAQMTGSGIRQETAVGAMVVQAPDLVGTGTAWGSAVGRIVLAAPQMQGHGAGSGAMVLPALRMTWAVTVGGVGSGAMVLPAPVMRGQGTEMLRASGAIVVQAPILFAGSNEGAIVLPAPVMVGYGSVTVAVTYEAYVVNLKHDLADAPDEVTRYTNYPFTRIVRFQGRYFGMAADGIYLLQGDLDGEDPIAWAFATHKTDWGSRQKKRVDALFVAGRMGHSATITATVGEKPDVTYRYRSPRGPDAQNFREKIGKGLSGRYWAFGIEDANGGELYLDALDPSVHESQRGI